MQGYYFPLMQFNPHQLNIQINIMALDYQDYKKAENLLKNIVFQIKHRLNQFPEDGCNMIPCYFFKIENTS